MQNMTKYKIFSLLLPALILVFGQTALAAGSVDSSFDPNRLIEDSAFKNKSAMSAAAIQQFLESKNSVLANTGSGFLALLKEPVGNNSLKATLEDSGTGSSPRTAAQLIADVSQQSGINPQVILVTLQKEQSLITGRQTATPEQLQRALDFSMGFGCPDSQPCGQLYKGFYYQLFGNVDSENNRYLGAGRSLMRSFSTPGGRGPFYNGAASKVGDTIVLSNTLGGYEGVAAQQTIKLENAATAALYRYTPHVFNGNYNFFRYMKEWFGTGSRDITSSGSLGEGSVIKYSSVYYMIEDGKVWEINDFVKKARKISTRSRDVTSVRSTEFKKYPKGGLLGLADNAVAKSGDKFYIFIDNMMYEATEGIIKQRGASTANAVTATEANLQPFMPAHRLPPKEGSVLRSFTGPEVYVVENAQLRLVSALVFEQRGLADKVQIIPDEELALYTKGGFMPPYDGTMVKSPSDQTVSLIAARIRRPIPSLAVFKTYGQTFADIKTISDDELNAITLGGLAEPKDNTYYKVAESGVQFVYRNNSSHYIAGFVAKQRGITPDVTLTEADHRTWPEGDPIMPKDGTLLKATDGPAVYIVEGEAVKALSGEDFKARGLSFANVVLISGAELTKYQGSQQ
jgi:hypothetical protein